MIEICKKSSYGKDRKRRIMTKVSIKIVSFQIKSPVNYVKYKKECSTDTECIKVNSLNIYISVSDIRYVAIERIVRIFPRGIIAA